MSKEKTKGQLLADELFYEAPLAADSAAFWPPPSVPGAWPRVCT